MPRLLQIIAVLLMALAVRSSNAFSLIGPLSGQPGGEAWQADGIGYNLPGELGSPKNLGEEYRWNIPVITYAFDPAFVNYFGTNGIAAVEDAIAVFNSLPDLSSLSQTLDEYPLRDPVTGASTTYRDSRRVNFRAQALGLLDMKSATMGILMEQLGLHSPEDFVFTLRARATIGPLPTTNYMVIMRNFDPVTYEPSRYVNGNRYTYQVFEPLQPGDFADAIENTVDPEHTLHEWSSVASFANARYTASVSVGSYYTYLTRDDIGGLRYIYDKDNLNWESFPAGTQILVPDRTNLTTITNLDLTLFSLRSSTLSASLLTNIYPGLIITGATPGVPITVENFPLISTQRVSITFLTNTSQLIVVSNIDLTTFSSITLTSPPAALIPNLAAAFPGVPVDQMQVASTSNVPTTIVQVASIDVVNRPASPWDDPFITNQILITNFTTNAGFTWHYTFRNVLTNYSGPTSRIRQIVSGVEREPWSSPFFPTYRTVTNEFTYPVPSGAAIIIPTNLLGYAFTGQGITNVYMVTNQVLTTNLLDPNTGLTRPVFVTETTLFTNVQYYAYPVEFLPQPIITNQLVTNGFVTTNITPTNFSYENVLTNYSGPETPARRVRYELIPNPLNPLGPQTNVLSDAQVVLPQPSGGFLIDTNLTGFEFSGISTTNITTVTNIVFESVDPATGVRTVEELIYNFTNVVYTVFPFIEQPAPPSLLRPGISKLSFQPLGTAVFSGTNFVHTNRFTATYYTNGILTSNVFVQVRNFPQILIGAGDLGTVGNPPGPVTYSRTPAWVNNAALNSANPEEQGGPGIIASDTRIDVMFNKVGPSFNNTSPPASPGEELAFPFFLWGRFDGSTNPPVVFPKDITLEDVELLITGGVIAP